RSADGNRCHVFRTGLFGHGLWYVHHWHTANGGRVLAYYFLLVAERAVRCVLAQFSGVFIHPFPSGRHIGTYGHCYMVVLYGILPDYRQFGGPGHGTARDGVSRTTGGIPAVYR